MARLDDTARVHRPRAMPVVGKASLGAWTSTQTAPLRGEPLAADVSRSGDLGYTYGSTSWRVRSRRRATTRGYGGRIRVATGAS